MERELIPGYIVNPHKRGYGGTSTQLKLGPCRTFLSVDALLMSNFFLSFIEVTIIS